MKQLTRDEEYDVVVDSEVGSMSAAVTVASSGLKVLLVEKTDGIGGSTKVSGRAV
jgi:phytoene dehydrogenase-like protein